MSTLSELDMLRDISVARATRVAELELQLATAARLFHVAQAGVRAILAGCGSLDEQSRASVPMFEVQRALEPDAAKWIAAAPLPRNVIPLRCVRTSANGPDGAA